MDAADIGCSLAEAAEKFLSDQYLAQWLMLNHTQQAHAGMQL